MSSNTLIRICLQYIKIKILLIGLLTLSSSGTYAQIDHFRLVSVLTENWKNTEEDKQLQVMLDEYKNALVSIDSFSGVLDKQKVIPWIIDKLKHNHKVVIIQKPSNKNFKNSKDILFLKRIKYLDDYSKIRLYLIDENNKKQVLRNFNKISQVLSASKLNIDR